MNLEICITIFGICITIFGMVSSVIVFIVIACTKFDWKWKSSDDPIDMNDTSDRDGWSMHNPSTRSYWKSKGL